MEWSGLNSQSGSAAASNGFRGQSIRTRLESSMSLFSLSLAERRALHGHRRFHQTTMPSIGTQRFWRKSERQTSEPNSPSFGPIVDLNGTPWGRFGKDGVLLVEAKAHIDEICSSPTGASPASLKKIKAALKETANYLGAKPRAAWTEVFYQLTNRLAHLYFLRTRRQNAWLILVDFGGDAEKCKDHPRPQANVEAAYKIVWHAARNRSAQSSVQIHSA